MNLRSGIFLSIPISCAFETFACFPQVMGLLEVDLTNFFFPVGSLSKSTSCSKMDYCLGEGLYGNCEC